jgi:hypothetical protein
MRKRQDEIDDNTLPVINRGSNVLYMILIQTESGGGEGNG